MQNFDVFAISVMHRGSTADSGRCFAAAVICDDEGKIYIGDAYAITTKWQAPSVDIRQAAEAGVDVSRIVSAALILKPVPSRSTATLPPENTTQPATQPDTQDSQTLDVQTDLWALQSQRNDYYGNRLGPPKSFYVQRETDRLRVGVVDDYEITFHNRAGIERPWITLTQGSGVGVMKKIALGINDGPGTGLMLLDTDGLDHLQKPHLPTDAKTPPPSLSCWPMGADGADSTSWQAECIWTSRVGALIQVKQSVGPFDALGRPRAELTWRFMIYQWGQMYVDMSLPAEDAARIGLPISWALGVNGNAIGMPRGIEMIGANSDPEKLLQGIYPKSVRDALAATPKLYPHTMETGWPVGMIAKPPTGDKTPWWSADNAGKRYFGVGIDAKNLTPHGGRIAFDCMMLINNPTALMMAGSFGQYLSPPRVRVRQGELDRTFPGDVDNDGFVDSYGFTVIRLAKGRASFVLDPTDPTAPRGSDSPRPVFYPAVLFTVPAVEREAVDLKNSRVLVNVDGKQFADPPQWPDGSFLLQLPYVLDRPVGIEAVLVRK